ncbi:Scr1 family TA system antitoxin-like transcriptional regulator [Glycomyces tritici]|uniref:Scr1 family TA system antitoxin-like transcriptional regulator n=1 Tax=Glycomyces tritici TaxID=2665176 RepID=A0ABT7YSY6_9ACTN|nr:Scr1 family TA system antitoxin-like transcriptional regulator [Glycomyces tritici]MDN3241711.1 Scr1 family TA system antitoxin-like transcriptional regulator [Glycomyces tritici]
MAQTELGSWFTRMMLRKGRLALDKTQREIAEEVCYSTDTYRAYEAGRATPPAKTIKGLAGACGLSAETAQYMVQVALSRKAGEALEADMRFNALFIALAEEYYGDIFKFDATLIPGPLQLQEYHYIVVRQTEPLATEQWIDGGWEFKEQRQRAIEARIDRPAIRFLIGEAALIQLRQTSEDLYQEQMRNLRRWGRKSGVSIRVLRELVPARMCGFDIYQEGESELAGPSVVYTEITDSSWLIDDPSRIASYDEIHKKLWKKAIRIEVYQDDDWRYRLA